MKLNSFIFKYTDKFFNQTCSPKILFVLSMCALPVLFFAPDLTVLWGIAAVFFLLAFLRRGKIRILPSIIITAGIVFFALLNPAGKVLYKGIITITEDSLVSGLHRSGILCGMVFLSQFAVSKNLKFPGTAGTFFAMTFEYFDRLTEQKISFKPGSIIQSIDQKLLDIF